MLEAAIAGGFRITEGILDTSDTLAHTSAWQGSRS